MNCKELSDFLMDYIEGALPQEQVAAFEVHLQKCPPCIHYLETYKQCVEVGKASCLKCEDESIPREIPDKLVQAILVARKEQA